MDAIRCMACFAVVLVHVTYDGGNGGNHAIGIYGYYAVASASIVFFMLTGALTLWRPRPLGPFLRERMLRVAVPMFIWSTITLLAECLAGRAIWHELPSKLVKSLVCPQVPYFWFIYMVMGMYLFVPILAAWLKQSSRRQVRLVLLVWFTSLCVPACSLIWPDCSHLFSNEYGTLFYAQGYMGLLLLGYYLRRWGDISHFRWGHVAIFILLLSVPLVLHVTHWHTATFVHRLAPNVVALGAVLVLLAKRMTFPAWSLRPMYVFSQLTFGVFLTHRIVTHLLVVPLFTAWQPNYWYGIPLATIISVLICATIAYALSFTPLAPWLGCSIGPRFSK